MIQCQVIESSTLVVTPDSRLVHF